MNTTVRSPVRFTQPFATVTDHVCCSLIINQAVSCQPLARYIVDIYILHVMHIPRRDYHFVLLYLAVIHPHGAFVAVLSVPISIGLRLPPIFDIFRILIQGLVCSMNDQIAEHPLFCSRGLVNYDK